jgi:hypothetical protein
VALKQLYHRLPDHLDALRRAARELLAAQQRQGDQQRGTGLLRHQQRGAGLPRSPPVRMCSIGGKNLDVA